MGNRSTLSGRPFEWNFTRGNLHRAHRVVSNTKRSPFLFQHFRKKMRRRAKVTRDSNCKIAVHLKRSDEKASFRQEDLDHAAQVLSWNKRLMSTLGLWPFRSNDLLFAVNFGYFSLLMILEYLDLFLFIGDLEHVIMNLTENMAFSQIFVRMGALRLYNGQIGEVIAEAMKDFDKTNYRTLEEMKTFISYNARSKIFVKLLMVFVALTASSYYLTPIIIILGSGESFLRTSFRDEIGDLC